MKNILILGLALCMGVSLSSCDDDNDVRPMAIAPTGDFNDDGTNNTGDDTITPNGDFIDDGTVDEFEDGSDSDL